MLGVESPSTRHVLVESVPSKALCSRCSSALVVAVKEQNTLTDGGSVAANSAS